MKKITLFYFLFLVTLFTSFAQERPFISTWKTDIINPTSKRITLFAESDLYAFDYNVDWGDGNSDTNVDSSISHTYEVPGTYKVSITGTYPVIGFKNYGTYSLLEINQWGTQQWEELDAAFVACKNMDVVATDTPNLQGVTSTKNMFRDCQSLKGNEIFNDWDVSTITDMQAMFYGAKAFNQDLDDWDVSNVISLALMFSEAESFNGAIGSWDVSNTTFLTEMFFRAKAFNQNIGDWNVTKVTRANKMFFETNTFNQDISNWDVSGMFSMTEIFSSAFAFNQDISSWDVSNKTSMSSMFINARAFNQDLSAWDVSKVTNMNSMFTNAQAFNQDISSWDVSNVTAMRFMFENARAFNQDIGNWDVSSLRNAENMFFGVTLATDNYDSLLSGWSDTISISDSIFQNFHGGNSQYCEGEEARQKLIDDFGWTVTDGGKAFDCSDEPVLPCPTSQVVLTTQQQIDDFGSTYFAGCTFQGGIKIQGANITNLNGLSQITFMSGSLEISGNPVLTDIGGLSAVRSAVGLQIFSNASLASLGDLSELTNIGANLLVSRNDVLIDISGLSGLTNVGGSLNISRNSALSNCEIALVCDPEIVAGDTQIYRNVGNCTDLTTAESVCSGQPDGVPVVDAGQDQIVVLTTTSSATLNGSGSDPDGGDVVFSWSQESGPNTADLSGIDSAELIVSNLIVGEYLFKLTVTDDENDTSFDEVTVTITNENPVLSCPSSVVILKTQQEVDDFATTYDVVNCTFDQGINIFDTDITNLNGLAGLVTVNGPLIISINPLLENISGLSSLSDVNFLTISSNPLLVDISGLSSLSAIDRNLEISNNVSLVNVNGLSSLKSVGVNILINRNDALSDLSGLSELTSVGGSLNISKNPVLSNCEIALICDATVVTGDSNIYQNTGDCADLAAAEAACSSEPEGKPIVDAGENQIIVLPITSSAVFNGTASDPNGGTIVSFEWTQIEGPDTAMLSGENTATLEVTGLITGSYLFRLTVIDDQGETGFDEVVLEVQSGGSSSPIVNAGQDQNSTESSITLTGSGSDPDGGDVVFLWTQENGPSTATLSGSDTAELIATNLIVGDYIFKLTVTDDENETAFDEVTVTITVENPVLTCPSTEVVLSTQQEVDAFATTYDVANCTFYGGIKIEGADITNLNGLSGLATVNGNLKISSNPVLTDMSGLSVLGTVGGNLTISSNASLGNLSGLSSLTSAGGNMLINRNTVLTDLIGLAQLTSIDGGLNISKNPVLSNCEIALICDATVVTGDSNIYQNTGDCADLDAAEAACSGGQQQQQAFVSTWKTDNPGASDDNQIRLFTTSRAEYNYNVDWGDNSSDSNVTGWITHTYADSGVYTIKITGNYPRIIFGANTDSEKLISVDQWGSQRWQSMQYAFRGCSNLEILATDIPDLSHVTDMSDMFKNCFNLRGNESFETWDVSNVELFKNMFFSVTWFNQNLSNWDVGNGTNFDWMFYSAHSFDQNLGVWNVSSVESMQDMFSNAGLSVENYDSTLIGWSVQALRNGVKFDAGASIYCEADTARQKMIDDFGWLITDEGKATFCGGTTLLCPSSQVVLTTQQEVDSFSSTYDVANCTFDQGIKIEGSDITNLNGLSGLAMMNGDLKISSNPVLTDMSGLSVLTTVNGNLTISSNASLENLSALSSLTSAGGNMLINRNAVLTDLNGLSNLASVSRGLNISKNPLLSNCEIALICDATVVTGDSNIYQNSGECAYLATAEAACSGEPEQIPFITTWKTDNSGTSEDNQITIPTFPGETYNYTIEWGDGTSDSGVTSDITHNYTVPGTYEVSISGNFPRINFNNNSESKKIISINQWGEIDWSSMKDAFSGCSNLNVVATDIPNLSNVRDLSKMFFNCSLLVFNPSISQWDVSGIENMNSMFGYSGFNGEIGSWVVSNVKEMGSMFAGTPFNQDIGNWDVSNVTNMSFMFGDSTIFNQNIGNWNVSNVTNMAAMFDSAEEFNQDISLWNVSNVKNMNSTFSYAESFNQDIGGWSVANVTNMDSMFLFASSFNQDISDWDVANVTRMIGMFQFATSFNQDIGGWDVGNVESMLTILSNATAFNQDLSGWNISKVSNMFQAFVNTSLTTENYDKILTTWSQLPTLQNAVDFWFGNTEFCLAEEARQKLIDDFGWVITDGGKADECDVLGQLPFITTWKTDISGTSANNQISIGADSQLTYDFDVDWGDGSVSRGITTSITHTYQSPGTYSVAITGTYPAPHWENVSFDNRKKLISVDSWGSTEWETMEYAFSFCSNLDVQATDVPDLSKVESMRNMFSNCDNLKGNESFSDWDVSNITTMAAMFYRAKNFNGNIGSWDVGLVTKMGIMFTEAEVFNQDIGSWDVSNVLDMGIMFQKSGFNQDIGDWDVSKVTSMAGLFDETSFNQDISLWDVSSVTSMLSMFSNSSFNQDISNWDVGSVTGMDEMFSYSAFNQDISNWNVSNVERMSFMFDHAVFNQDISGWDVSKVRVMQFMFSQASEFNQPIGAWDVGHVLTMNSMFRNSGFNQDIANWDVSSVTDMKNMFRSTAFNYDLGNWNVGNVTNMEGMFQESEFNQDISTWNVSKVGRMNAMFNGPGSTQVFSLENYDLLLQGWSELALQVNVTFDGSINYCQGEAAREKIISDFGWTINDAGKALDCNSGLSGKSTSVSNNSILSPNPATTSTTLSFENPVQMKTIQVFDVLGRLVTTYEGPELNDDGVYLLNVNFISAGTYFLKSHDVDGNLYQKQMVIIK